MPKQSSEKKSGGGSSRKKAQKEPDALELLKADHETVLSLFGRHESASSEEQASLAKQIFNELTLHATVEEELFYPALREEGDLNELAELESGTSEVLDDDAVSEDEDEDEEEVTLDSEEEGDSVVALAYEDHKAVKELIEELKGIDPASDQYRERFLEMKEAVTDHIEEEEEVLFAEARLKVDTKKLGAAIMKRRSDLASSMAA
jgi:hemerythrin superfamily protein